MKDIGLKSLKVNRLNRLKLSRMFVVISYMIGAWVLPMYFAIQFVNWALTNLDRFFAVMLITPLSILMGLWFLLCLGLFGYSISEE